MQVLEQEKSLCTKMFPLYFFLLFAAKTFASPDTITFGQSLTDGKTIVSANGRFELGFFNRSNSKNHYVGIWYKIQSPDKVVVWVANRETPLNDSLGVLSLTRQGILVLDGKNRTIWSSNKAVKSEEPVLQLLDTGNLVVKDGNGSDSSGRTLWQSFDYPCDTLLPEMKIGRNLKTGQEAVLTSWKSADNPGKGKFSLLIDPSGFPQLVVRNGNIVHYRLGPWNGLSFSGTPELLQNRFLKFNFELNESGVHYWYEGLNSLTTRLLVNRTGFLERFGWLTTSQIWQLFYYAPRDACDKYSSCGPYMSCNMLEESPKCDCLEGFALKSFSNLSDGCVRKDRLDCKSDMFRPYRGMKLPDTSSSWYNTSISLQECKELCLKNCSCVAYANSNITREGSGCILWFSDLVDMRQYSEGGQDLYIRMSSPKSETRRLKLGIAVGSAILAGALITGFVWCAMNRKQRKQGLARGSQKNDYISQEGGEEMELPIFDLNVLVKATDNFSDTNKLGKGGFGTVYKGTLSDGQEIAVKRLSKSSGQGLTEFKNEVILIAKLQHRNLVKLLGCCIQGDEKMLVYEFMPNKSLDNFIYDQTRSNFLNWERRFQIIGGIARGLLYLHQDSRLRIIHRDLKASNVLLDKDMNPKISDFGMARMFGGDEVGADTNKVVGTYGYMAPEYAVDGHFSIKSDVFSFGVLVLEVVTGKKNRGFSHPDHSLNLLGHAWKLWMEEKSLELVDNSLNDHVASQVIRCIHVGLLCVQQRPEDRPEMSSVVVMLGSDNSLPEPKHPGFFIQRDIPEPETSSSKHELLSANEMSITLLDPR